MTYSKLPMKRIAEIDLGKMVQPAPSSPNDVTAPYLRAAHVQPNGRILDLDPQPMWFSPTELKLLTLRSQDVVIVEGGAGFGRSALLKQDLDGWGFQNSIVRIRCRDNAAIGGFVNYALQAALADGQIAVACNTATLPHFTAEKVASFEIPCPAIAVQERVVEFLDRETAEIDAFIADQEELIRLLSERRAATIGHAVTKGLDRTAAMNETASPWFPSLPYGWELMPVWLAASLIQTGPFGSQLHADEYIAGGVPLVNPMHMVDGEIKPTRAMSVTTEKAAELQRHALRLGDVVIARRGELGRSAVVTANSVGALCGTGSAIVRLNPDKFDPEYFRLVFSSSQTRDALLHRSIGSTMDNLNADLVGGLRLPAPPIDEQRAVVDHLRREVGELDAAIADAREAIALSRERRAALISAAVAGKIDVREHALSGS